MTNAINKAAYVYVSNAKDGTVSRYSLDKTSLTMVPLGETPAGPNVMPLTVSPDKTYLYAAIRSEPYRVVSYRIDPESGALTEEAVAPLPDSMANIDLDLTGRFLFAASYGGHKVSVSAVNKLGHVGDVIQVLATGRNAHAIHPSPDNDFVFATSLGDDHIGQYRFDEVTGKLSKNVVAMVASEKGDGPRHFVFSPNGQYVYCLGELSGVVITYQYDESTGLLSYKSAVQAVPSDKLGLVNGVPPSKSVQSDHPPVWAADIHVTSNGQFLYVSERTCSIICCLQVEPKTGRVQYQGHVEVEKQPRGFALTEDGQYMVVSGEAADHLGVYQLNDQTGMPVKVSEVPSGQGANWVEIVEF
ncbi:lactonase family protein [Marinomonas spartinae]|uniref:lactonase family protein n=1 Tax=Marinomonas spartinae TaxID=1792290 RepID=UPI0018F238E6|nr:beta-propeller fold lactonase family protein [Marinomonas spartinae]MBJ7554974.1 beta-propeller fold lactonase family protein [Marinomonas spartinae]